MRGGGGLVIVARSAADEAQGQIQNVLWSATRQDLHSVAVTLPVWPRDLSAEPASPQPHRLDDLFGPDSPSTPYQRTTGALFNLLARARSRQTRLAREVAGDARRCEACGEREVPADRRLCSPCDARRGYGYHHKVHDHIAEREISQPSSFEDLLEGYSVPALAVLYADGANVGAAFQAVSSAAEHRRLSQAVENAFRKARERAIGEIPPPDRVDPAAPSADLRAQYPICGGDDLVLIVPAVGVLAAAQNLMASIEDDFDTLAAEGGWSPGVRDAVSRFGVGVGITLAAPHFPARFLLRYAKELLGSAKEKIHADPAIRSAVDYLVLRTGTPLGRSLASLRAKYGHNHARARETPVFFSRKPYSRGDFEAFLRNAERLAEVDRSQIHGIRREVERGYELSLSVWRYQHARSNDKDPRGWAAYRRGLKIEEVDTLLWREAGERDGKTAYATEFLDAFEVLDYVGRRG